MVQCSQRLLIVKQMHEHLVVLLHLLELCKLFSVLDLRGILKFINKHKFFRHLALYLMVQVHEQFAVKVPSCLKKVTLDLDGVRNFIK